MNIIFFDTETTGNANEDRLCQLAVKEFGVSVPVVNATYKPPLPISIEAMAIHHITEKMVAERPLFSESGEYTSLKALFESPDTVAVAHNASFDIGMLSREGITPNHYICTYKVARALDPGEKIKQYKLQYLRHLLGLEIDALAHDAMGDVLVLEGVFNRLLVKMTETKGSREAAIEEMIRISAQPLLYTTLRFGKHDGERIADIAKEDRSYLEWLLGEKRKKPEGEADWIYTLEYYLSHV
jgi:exodeoxyribonuclease X